MIVLDFRMLLGILKRVYGMRQHITEIDIKNRG